MRFAILGPMMSGPLWEIHAADCHAVMPRQAGKGRNGHGGSNGIEPEYVERESSKAARDALLAELEDNDTPCGEGDVKIHSCTRRHLPTRDEIRRKFGARPR